MLDIRWKQRFVNLEKAYDELVEIKSLRATRPLSRLEQQGAIQCFEYTHELAWNTLKDYLVWQGITGIVGSRDTTREAFRKGLINDGEVWMTMITARNTTSHAYDQATADTIYQQIFQLFYPAFESLMATLGELVRQNNDSE